MGRKKTTGDLSKGYSFRLHPNYGEDAQAIQIIDDLISQGWSVRQIMTDAILRCGGFTPEMFSKRDLSPQVIEGMFDKFAREIVAEVGRRGDVVEVMAEEVPDEENMWVNNFAKGFLSRQAQVLGEGDDA